MEMKSYVGESQTRLSALRTHHIGDRKDNPPVNIRGLLHQVFGIGHLLSVPSATNLVHERWFLSGTSAVDSHLVSLSPVSLLILPQPIFYSGDKIPFAKCRSEPVIPLQILSETVKHRVKPQRARSPQPGVLSTETMSCLPLRAWQS